MESRIASWTGHTVRSQCSKQKLETEARNVAWERRNELTSLEIVELMNREDASLSTTVTSQKNGDRASL